MYYSTDFVTRILLATTILTSFHNKGVGILNSYIFDFKVTATTILYNLANYISGISF